MTRALRIVASIEARMTSSRLPGKVLLPAAGKPMLQILVERLKQSQLIQDVIVATTVNKEDDPIAKLCEKIGISCHRGSEMNVLDRVCGAAKQAKAEALVETTGDCPLLDPELTDDVIEAFLQDFPKHRYVSNSGPNRTLPDGLDVQVFLASDLYEINASSPSELEKEHVSYRFYQPKHNQRYNPKFLYPDGELNRPEIMMTLDYREDYELLRQCYENLISEKPRFGAIDVVRWLDANPKVRDAAIAVRKAVT